MSLPPADWQYQRDIDSAYWTYSRKMFSLMHAYSYEPDARKAVADYNAGTPPILEAFRSAINKAQAALRERSAAAGVVLCDACHQAMTVIEPGQRYHPNCEPAEDDDW